MSGAPGTPSQLQHRVETLERELRHARVQIDKLLELRSGLTVPPQQLRLVQTFDTEDEEDPYPDPPGNTFHIRFLDAAQSVWTPGERTPTFETRSAQQQTTAGTFDGRFVLPGKNCLAGFFNEKWWIVDGPGFYYHGRVLAELGKDGSALMEILDWNGTKYIRTGFELTVFDCYLNTGKVNVDRTKVDVRLTYPGRYDVVNAYCATDSNADSVYNP